MKRHSFKMKAFTLAEVLITLGIIGVVAAMTMPSLIANHKTKEYVVKLKKVYSVMSQAYILALKDYESPDNWDLISASDSQGAMNIINKFAPYLNFAKKCEAGEGGCWYESLPAYRQPVLLSDGTAMYFQVIDKDCEFNRGNSIELAHTCGAFGVDLNGKKPPNENGKDIFQFYITKYNIVPYGTEFESNSGWTFDGACKGEAPTGRYGCTAWVIQNENMDYLKCGSELSWGGKTKCGN